MVFAFRMASMLISDLRVIGQLGATIGLDLLVDTFIVRSLMTPSIAAALGRWFWWPLNTFRTASNNTSTSKPDMGTEPIPQPTTV
jgi:RND superfamily putative drug exporter